MRYRIRNYTDLDKAEIRQLIKIAGADLDFTNGVIYVEVRWTQPQKKSPNYAASGTAIHPCIAVLRIARPEQYPAPWYDLSYSGHVVGDLQDWRECLVAIAAHEFKHLAERQRGSIEVGRLMEGRCDAYAAGRLNVYREEVAAHAYA